MPRSSKNIGSTTEAIFDIHKNSTKDTEKMPCLFLLLKTPILVDITKGPTVKVEPYML